MNYDQNQKTSSLSVWVVVIAAAVGAPLALSRGQAPAVVLAPQAATPDLKSEEPKPSLREHCVQRWHETLVETVVGRHSAPPAPGEAWSDLAKQLGSKVDVDVFVATIPDPIDSGFGYAFQTHLQAARLGLEENLPSRANDPKLYRTTEWLPWYEVREEHRKRSAECRRLMPGLVVFRTDQKERFAIMLLVGETPTGGVHPIAMAESLNIARALDWRRTPRRLRILGPTFSGSASSMRKALEEFQTDERWRVSIVSGTATAPGVRDQLLNYGFDHGQVEFWTTTVPEDVLQCRYLNFLRHWLGVNDTHGQLNDVALLQESGTEFGAGRKSGNNRCKLRPGFSATFPANIAAVRDSYDSIESSNSPKTIGRRTSLDASLREAHTAPGIASEPSPKATFASDAAISRTIAAIRGQRVRHVGIQATDVSDVIFLSRKIRDVAPDVRVAMFQADTLLLHSNFRRSLQGSIVVTPYPFLGSSELSHEEGSTSLKPIENSEAQGVFNAMLALRGAKATELLEYTLVANASPIEPRYDVLPVWVTAIGVNGFVPLALAPHLLREDREELLENPVFPGLDNSPSAGKFRQDHSRFLTINSTSDDEDNDYEPTWKRPLRKLHSLPIGAARNPRPAESWSILASLACIAFIIDSLVQKQQTERFADGELPRRIDQNQDRLVDFAAVRLKWELYASIRTWIGALTIGYLVYWSEAGECGFSLTSQSIYIIFALLGLVYVTRLAIRTSARFLRYLLRFLQAQADESFGLPNAETTLFDRCAVYLGLARPEQPLSLARVTQYQAVTLASIVIVLALCVVTWHVLAISGAQHVLAAPSAWARYLMTSRTLTLVGGVSVATPTLLLAGVFYLWTTSRMSRLLLVHGLSRMTPADKVADFVSTPIRMILDPSFHLDESPTRARVDTALSRIERGSVNAIVRPMTGPYYLCAWLGSLVLPWILFGADAPSTLERDLHEPLICLIYLAYVIIACSLLQLFQYWAALELLLKSVLQHWLGRAFERVAPFVQDSIDEQISRTPHDLLRLAEVVEEYSKLARWAHKPGNTIAAPHLSVLNKTSEDLAKLREDALESIRKGDRRERFSKEAALGLELVASTARLVDIVEKERAASSSQKRLGQGAVKYHKDNITWIRDVESFAATVLTILINRHVRQLQYFVYPLLASTVLFMSAILSYPFEPQRRLTSFVWALVFLSVFIAVWTYLQLDRNSLLSRIATTRPGRITPNMELVFRLLAWGAAPVIVALAAEYPDLVNSMFTWIAPLPPWRTGS